MGCEERRTCHVIKCPSTSNCSLLVQVNGEPKVAELDDTLFIKQYILGLDVSVNNALQNGVVDRIR